MSDWLTAPNQPNHRRYEAPRAFYLDGLTHAQAGERFGHTRWGWSTWSASTGARRQELFAPPRKPTMPEPSVLHLAGPRHFRDIDNSDTDPPAGPIE